MSFTEQEKKRMLALARQTVAYAATYGQKMALPNESWPESVKQRLASFVTLTIAGQLRGCMGTLEPYESLIDSIISNAFNAARRDPRFLPVTVDELDRIDYEISVLSTPQPLSVDSEQALLAALTPGKDGLIIEEGNHRATYLPSVWSQLPEPKDFVRQLKLKARLPENYWSENLKCWTYQTEFFGQGHA